MTYSIKTFATLSILVLAATGCDKEGSLGEYPTTTDASGGSEGTGGTDGGTESEGSAESASATETSADSGSATDTGVTGCGPGQCEVFPLECGPEGCTDLGRIDGDGCLRPSCGSDDQCAPDELCYRPMDFGGCASSDVFCDDDFEAMQCSCGSTDDCGGAYCVPAAAYPVPEEGPTDAAIVSEDCAPDDGPAMSFSFGLANEACGDPAPPETAVVHIRLDYFDQAIPVHEFGIITSQGWGTYDPGDGMTVDATFGRVSIDAWVDTSVTGSYDLFLEDGRYFAGQFEATYCPEEPVCG